MATVLSFLVPNESCSPRKLFGDAAWCNGWAKRTSGETRRLLYQIKNECLSRLLQEQHKKSVSVRGDTDRHRGLLSIALSEHPRRRLHTHENWLGRAC